MIDASDCLEGEGAFANDRCCTVPVGKLVRLCYSGKYDLKGMLRHINGEAGLISYLGTTNIREIVQRIEDGDEYARNVMEAMCYQVAKDVGAMATVLKGELDAIILTGGMANVPFITEHITDRTCGGDSGRARAGSPCGRLVPCIEGRYSYFGIYSAEKE